MLKTDAAHAVGQRQQEIVVIKVMTAVELQGLGQHVPVGLFLLRLGFQKFRSISDDVQAHRRVVRHAEINHLEILAGEQRRVHQLFESGLLERGCIATGRCRFKTACELPAFGQLDAGHYRDLACEITGGIKRH